MFFFLENRRSLCSRVAFQYYFEGCLGWYDLAVNGTQNLYFFRPGTCYTELLMLGQSSNLMIYTRMK